MNSFPQSISAHTGREPDGWGCVCVFAYSSSTSPHWSTSLWLCDISTLLFYHVFMLQLEDVHCDAPRIILCTLILFWALVVFHVFLWFLVSNCGSKLQIFRCESITWNNCRISESKNELWAFVMEWGRGIWEKDNRIYVIWMGKWGCDFGGSEVNVDGRKVEEE